MSHTFTANPSRSSSTSRGRAAGRGRSRGASANTSRLSQAGAVAQPTGASVNTNRSTGIANSQGSRLGRGRSATSSMNSYAYTNNTRTGARGRGRMDFSQNQSPGQRGDLAGGQPGMNGEQQQNDPERSEQYASGFTVIPRNEKKWQQINQRIRYHQHSFTNFLPYFVFSASGFTVIPRNEKKWQQINQQAQKETAAYERYKQDQKVQSCSYVGTVGGGQLSEDQARARQAHQVRAAKFNRQMKQAEQRQAARKAEEDAIEAKRAEARRKAELNAQRQARVPPAAEVRRNREAFLAQFEMNSPGKNSSTPQQTSAETPSSNPVSVKFSPTHRREGNSNNSHAATKVTPVQASPGRIPTSATEQRSPSETDKYRFQQGHVETRPQVFQNREHPDRMKIEVKQEEEEEEEEEGEEERFSTAQEDQEVQILMSMYPDMAVEDLADLLRDMGSLERALDILDLND
ncbi:epithelial-stromal interaction protein 1-like [Elysia marginata]|uniref:Epithelial-stromal interaction protein 1-like n=1 Tax=Elysia marginata TaxID=1093978 RepID=A0AAV4FWC8_9GAST|nr:epithelial-stromal interaction protein 1-like [Elysia marginata]